MWWWLAVGRFGGGGGSGGGGGDASNLSGPAAASLSSTEHKQSFPHPQVADHIKTKVNGAQAASASGTDEHPKSEEVGACPTKLCVAGLFKPARRSIASGSPVGRLS